jgi:hypothetical protein
MNPGLGIKYLSKFLPAAWSIDPRVRTLNRKSNTSVQIRQRDQYRLVSANGYEEIRCEKSEDNPMIDAIFY